MLTRPDAKEDGFDYDRYLQTLGITSVLYAKGVWPMDEERYRARITTLAEGVTLS